MNVPSKYRNVLYIITVVFAAIAGVATVFGLVDPAALEEGNQVAGQVVELINTLTIAFALASGFLAKKNLAAD